MGRSVKVDRERVAWLTAQGRSASQIAEELNCSPRQVIRVRGLLGMAQPKAPLLTDEQINRAERLIEDGCSLAEVARTIGCHPWTVHKRFRGRGWSRAEAARFAAFMRDSYAR